MSRQIQIRRGSAAEHATFTGAIGEITMDTTNNTLRVHDGTTAGGTILAKQSEIPVVPDFPAGMDYVVETQLPTSENSYTWYRKYKSGWVEQGGRDKTNSGNPKQVTLPIEMASIQYNVHMMGQTAVEGYSNASWFLLSLNSSTHPKSKTYFYAQPSISGYNLTFFWHVCGVAAQES